MASYKWSFVKARTEDNEPRSLYEGFDAGEANAVWKDAMDGRFGKLYDVQLTRNHEPDRNRDVPDSALNSEPAKEPPKEPAKRRGRPPKVKEQTGDAQPSTPAPALTKPPEPEPNDFETVQEPEQIPPQAEIEPTS
jgi:hypothetical protein